MKSLKVWIAISAIIVIIVIVGITNLDELIYPEVENVASQVEFDDSTIRMVTNTYAVNTVCEYALLSKEIGVSPLVDHTEWYKQKFGDLQLEFKENFQKFIEEEQRLGYSNLNPDPNFQEKSNTLIQVYLDKVKSRINPSIIADYEFGFMPGLLPEHLEEDPSCAAIVQEYYPYLIP